MQCTLISTTPNDNVEEVEALVGYLGLSMFGEPEVKFGEFVLISGNLKWWGLTWGVFLQ